MTTLIKPLIAGAFLLAIPAEGVLLYTNAQDAITKRATADNSRDRQQAEAKEAAEKAKTALQVANNAAELKKAEADKMFAEAKTAEEVANNAKARRAAEVKTAEAKAEQEYQAAQNAERKASADADKLEAEAITAKRFGDTAIQRSRAEAAKAAAELDSIKANIRQAWKYPYSCMYFDTFPECVEGLRQAVANGQWKVPRPVPEPKVEKSAKGGIIRIHSDAAQPSRSCVQSYYAWRDNPKNHYGAFAVGNTTNNASGGCSWTGAKSDADTAAREAIEQCQYDQKVNVGCRIYADK